MSKLILAVLHQLDAEGVVTALEGAGHRLTQIPSMGGYLGLENVTLKMSKVAMLRITKEAAQQLLRVRTESGFDERAAARFVRASAGLGLTFAVAPEAGDQVLTDSELPIFVAEDVTEIVSNSVIDVAADHDESRLVLRLQPDVLRSR